VDVEQGEGGGRQRVHCDCKHPHYVGSITREKWFIGSASRFKLAESTARAAPSNAATVTYFMGQRFPNIKQKLLINRPGE
jgi:hypothetical protein